MQHKIKENEKEDKHNYFDRAKKTNEIVKRNSSTKKKKIMERNNFEKGQSKCEIVKM